MCSSNPPPPAPDYTGAAQATSAGNLEAARATATANKVDQYTPDGSIRYVRLGAPDRWAMVQKLSPAQQAIYNQNQRVNTQLGNVAEKGVGYVNTALAKPLSTEGMYDVGTPGEIQQEAADAAYANAVRYLDPQMEKRGAALDVKLANQGITQGSEAYNNAMDEFAQHRDAQYETARNQAYLQGLQGANQEWNQGTGLRQQQLTEAQLLQQNPINMLNAVRTGQQMQTARLPQQMQTATQQGYAGPDLLGAASAEGTYNQGLYNTKQAQTNNTTSGLFNLGAAAMDTWG